MSREDAIRIAIEEYGAAVDPQGWGIDALDVAVDKVTKQIKELEEEFGDINDAYKATMDEKCNEDLEHCTCVPFLRKRIKHLEEEVKDLEDCVHRLNASSDPQKISSAIEVLEETKTESYDPYVAFKWIDKALAILKGEK